MSFSATTYFVGVFLMLLQVLAAAPWLLVSFVTRADWNNWRRQPFGRNMPPLYGALVAIVFVVPAVFHYLVQEGSALEAWGQVYAALLEVQLLIDAFIGVFALLLFAWPKGGAIALAAFREGVRQPMFWLLFGLAFLAMTISPLIPYFTFNEDHLVVREIGYDTIILAAAIFGTLAASMSISEEIEGRTAVTLMSKPVSRRHFLIGKFLGLILAAAVCFALLGVYFQGITLFKAWWDKMDHAWWAAENGPKLPAPPWVMATLQSWDLPGVTTDLLRGIGLWTHLTLDIAPGLILGFSQVMFLIAIAVSLATRVPMVVNLITVVVIFTIANVTPTLVAIGYQAQRADPGAAVSQILYFMAQLFDYALPSLKLFRLEPALLQDNPIGAIDFTKFLSSVSLYGLLYTSIALLFGLILFEDRDLA